MKFSGSRFLDDPSAGASRLPALLLAGLVHGLMLPGLLQKGPSAPALRVPFQVAMITPPPPLRPIPQVPRHDPQLPPASSPPLALAALPVPVPADPPLSVVTPVWVVPDVAPPLVAARLDADSPLNLPPRYPASSRRAREEGTVVLVVRVSAEGLAEEVSIRQGSGYPALDQAALEAVRRWRFLPVPRGEQRLAASVVVPVEFSLDR
ncbi:energy transducer TonB [Denitratisoma oestradiolicum]|uniref:energy transducer TonB n=1 Tax=Denitratisoma oestradiolicum TaxID=311182 RepID=UPI00119F1901|nr:energy transducer TonB [Denitratisoma oestradiolicum]TWO80041.1 hypothetical protein CBW56_12055 [Denitratisoma oestradiolicum]